MARRVVRRSSGFRRSPGRLTEWIGIPFQTDATTLPLSSKVIHSGLTAAGKAKLPFTVTRSVGMISIFSDQAGAVEHPLGAVGAVVVSDTASALGITAVPDPVTDVSSDFWLMYQSFVGPQNTAIDGAGPTHFPIDSRGQRKIADGEDLLVIIANSNAVDGLRYVFNMRFLVKLS